jgi:hypothetical protein
MNSRVEPRFKTDASITVRLLRDKDNQLPGRIVDVSGTGFHLLLKQALAVGEHARIIAGDRHLLVTVRYCVPVEDGYSVGVERIDDWLPDHKAEPPEKVSPDVAVPALGRPHLKEDLGVVRTVALRGLFSRQSARKSHLGLLLGGIAVAIGIGVFAFVFDGIPGNLLPKAPLPASTNQTEGTRKTGIAVTAPEPSPCRLPTRHLPRERPRRHPLLRPQ